MAAIEHRHALHHSFRVFSRALCARLISEKLVKSTYSYGYYYYCYYNYYHHYYYYLAPSGEGVTTTTTTT